MDQTNIAMKTPAFVELIDLASSRMGGCALLASDDFFAAKENLLLPEVPVFIPGKFTDRGKWMDGWESRRKREPGHDWCIIALGRPGAIHGVNINTAHFNGNQPEACTLEGAEFDDGVRHDDLLSAKPSWITLVPRMPLRPSSEHFIALAEEHQSRRFTHVRLNIFPDGGVARLRIHGRVLPDWKLINQHTEVVDLAGAVNGGLVVACNDMHFGSRHNLIMPGRAANMGDGWETRRKRGLTGGEHDWCIAQLGHRGTLTAIEVDTNHFKGNFPESCLIEGCDAALGAGGIEAVKWTTLLPRTKLAADTQHTFKVELDQVALRNAYTHVRLKIFPDGGVSRLRVWGRPVV